MLTQRRWRTIGLLTLAGSAILAIGGIWVERQQSPIFFALYWTLFLLLFMITLWMVLLDIRYIRLQYSAGKRELYQQFLADEALRTALRAKSRPPAQEQHDSHRANGQEP